MLPMEKVRMVWREDSFNSQQQPQASFRLQDRWRANTHLPAVINFRFVCRCGRWFSVQFAVTT